MTLRGSFTICTLAAALSLLASCNCQAPSVKRVQRTTEAVILTIDQGNMWQGSQPYAVLLLKDAPSDRAKDLAAKLQLAARDDTSFDWGANADTVVASSVTAEDDGKLAVWWRKLSRPGAELNWQQKSRNQISFDTSHWTGSATATSCVCFFSGRYFQVMPIE